MLILTTKLFFFSPPHIADDLFHHVFIIAINLRHPVCIDRASLYDRAGFSEFLTPELKSRRTNKKSYRGGCMARSRRRRASPHSHVLAQMCGAHAREAKTADIMMAVACPIACKTIRDNVTVEVRLAPLVIYTMWSARKGVCRGTSGSLGTGGEGRRRPLNYYLFLASHKRPELYRSYHG